MRHIIFNQQASYETAILIKEAAFMQPSIEKFYVEPLVQSGYDKNNIIAFDLEYSPGNKAPVKLIKDYLSNLMPALKKLGVKYIYCADSNYFKVLTKNKKAEHQIGYILPCGLSGFEDMQVTLGVNYQALTYNPLQSEKLDLSVSTLINYINGSYQAIGSNIIKWAYYPQTEAEIDKAFQVLHTFPSLACDIETFSLHPYEAGLGTISFSPSSEGGVGFACDVQVEGGENVRIFNSAFRVKLREFFESYKGNLKFHKADFDVKVIIYNLWMKSPLDYEGLAKGRDIICKDWDDTRVIAYLALNSTAGNELSLKALAHPFAGNWAVEEITNILAIPLPKLLQYNVVDTMSTMWVSDKYTPKMIADNQQDLYRNLMMPSQKVIMQMELLGMPMVASKVDQLEKMLLQAESDAINIMRQTSYVKEAEVLIQKAKMEAANAKLKVKQHPLSAFSNIHINFNSGDQLQTLLYEVMKLPVLDYTKTKQPSTKSDVLEKLVNHCKTEDAKNLLKALVDYSKISKIISSFIPAFKSAFDKGDGRVYLLGGYNLGGTVSGRLSSSEPNMQQLPSGSRFGKPVKDCFSAPPGWIFAGADFASLEDRINALLTQDPNKIKVYTDGFDGHSLRAASYFADQCPDIDIHSVASVNSLKKLYPVLRDDSKAPTFALTYLGTWMTLVRNCGFTKEQAQAIEKNFHELYKVSGEWVANEIQKACDRGYGVGAFGLRIRTPLLAKSILGTNRTLREAEAEGRTLGNAISGQSYGLLTNRAVNEFMQRVWASPHKHDIQPCALIHDAIYLLIRNKPEIVKFVNDNLIDCMAWKGLPEISDPRIPLSAELDLFFPSWAKPITLANNLTADEIVQAVTDELASR